MYVVDDDEAVRDALRMLLDSRGYGVCCCNGPEDFMTQFDPGIPSCVILDLDMPGTSGLELHKALATRGGQPSVIFLTGHGDVPAAVRALKQGAIDFLQKPIVDDHAFLALVDKAVGRSAELTDRDRRLRNDQLRMEQLTPREREILEQVCMGKANKVIAADLGISERTVELHRGRVVRKLGVRSVAELVKLRARLRS